jgi:hypothetical protein
LLAKAMTFELSSFRLGPPSGPSRVIRRLGGGASSVEGFISTRAGNAGSWLSMIGKPPEGEWELVLPNTVELKQRFAKDDIEDILFVVTVAGRTPEWPL